MNNKILIIEDLEVTLFLIQNIFEQIDGFETILARDGYEGLQLAETTHPDLILLDISMPKMDGFEACTKLKQNEKTKDIPIIFTSAFIETSEKLKAFQLGGVDYITKPFNADELVARVNTQLKISNLQKELQKANEHLEEKVKTRTIQLEKEIEERKQVEQALRESEARYRLIADYTNNCEIFRDNNGKLIYCSPVFEKITGYKREDYLNGIITIKDLVHPDDLIEVNQKFQEALNKGRINHFEFRILAKGKKIKYIDVSTQPVLIDNKEFIGFRSSLSEITEQRKMQNLLIHTQKKLQKINENLEQKIAKRTQELVLKNESIAKSENIFRIFTNYSSVWESFRDKKGKVLYCTPAFEKISEYSLEEYFAGKIELLDLIHPKDKDDFKIQIKKLIANENITDFECTIITKTGKTKYVSISVWQVFLENGEKFGFRTSIIDVTQRKLALDALRETKDYLENLFNYSNAPIIVWEQGNKIIRFNKAFENLTGFNASEIIGKPFDILFPIDSLNISLKKINETSSGKNWEIVEIPIFCKTGETKTVLWNSSNIYAADGVTLLATIAQGQDISSRIETEKKVFSAIIEAEEKERIHFARNLHDGLGPLLSSIKLCFEWLNKEELKTPKEEILKKIDYNIEEAISTVKEISNNLSPHILTNFGLAFALNSFIEKINLTHKIEIHFETNINQRLLNEIEITLYRALLECINNTMKHAYAKNIYVKLLLNNSIITVDYLDDGVGFNFDEAIKAQKGLGLFNIQNRITSIGGAFSIESQVNQGVKIHFLINL